MRKATIDDIPSILALCHILADSDNYKNSTFDLAYIQKNLESAVSNPSVDVFVYESGGQIIGSACGAFGPTLLCPDNEYAELFVVCVDPRGTLSLLKALETAARERQAKHFIIGSSTAENSRYCQLLIKKGFNSFGHSFRKVL